MPRPPKPPGAPPPSPPRASDVAGIVLGVTLPLIAIFGGILYILLRKYRRSQMNKLTQVHPGTRSRSLEVVEHCTRHQNGSLGIGLSAANRIVEFHHQENAQQLRVGDDIVAVNGVRLGRERLGTALKRLHDKIDDDGSVNLTVARTVFVEEDLQAARYAPAALAANGIVQADAQPMNDGPAETAKAPEVASAGQATDVATAADAQATMAEPLAPTQAPTAARAAELPMRLPPLDPLTRAE